MNVVPNTIQAIMVSLRPFIMEFGEAIALPSDFACLAAYAPNNRLQYAEDGSPFLLLLDTERNRSVKIWSWDESQLSRG